jgi:ATP-binding cassette subfamily B protein
LHDVALCLTSSAMLVWCVMLWRSGRITPGDVVLISALTFRILHGSRDTVLSLVEMTQQFGVVEETLRRISSAEPEARLVEVRQAPEAALAARENARGRIVFDDVSFGYRPGVEQISNVSLDIPAGQKLGIVGPSGAGKSTLLALLQGLYDVDHGRILIDGCPIASLPREALFKLLAVVPQEITLFHRTIMDNIRFADPAAGEAMVRAAADDAQCARFATSMPEGFDTIVGERGTKLSGGQRQRIAIARAFLKRAPITLLDEATSALDTDSELAVQQAIRDRLAGRTVIAVAHRLSTLAAFDRIIVLDRGRIVEDGTPRDLRRFETRFRRMWQRQAEGLALAES